MLRITSPHAPEAPHAAPPAVDGWPTMGALPTVAASMAPNPTLRMGPELGLVVLEFRSHGDEATVTIPASRELEALRRAVRTGAPEPAPWTRRSAYTALRKS